LSTNRFGPAFALAGIILFWGLGPPVSKLIEALSVISVLHRFWMSVPLMWLLATATGNRPAFGSPGGVGGCCVRHQSDLRLLGRRLTTEQSTTMTGSGWG